MLGLSAQSVRAWLDAGVLDVVPSSQPRQVSTPRLVLVVSLVHRLSRAGRDRDLLRAVVDRLEDDRVSTLPRVRCSLDQLRRGQVEALSAENLCAGSARLAPLMPPGSSLGCREPVRQSLKEALLALGSTPAAKLLAIAARVRPLSGSVWSSRSPTGLKAAR